MRPALSTATRYLAVLGDPVEHSLSPAIHGAALDAAGIDAHFAAHRVTSPQLAVAVRGLAALGYLGASITVPHKQAVLSLCDEVSERARQIGAVNCLRFVDGAIHGDNTDAPGFVAAVEARGIPVKECRAVLLGAGGAARAVWAGLVEAGAAAVTVVARRPEAIDFCEPHSFPQLAALLPTCDLLVDCTSAGLASVSDNALAASIPVEALPPTATVSTLIYHRKTALCERAAERGLAVMDGAGMLVHQGAIAFRSWFDVEPDLRAMAVACQNSNAAKTL